MSSTPIDRRTVLVGAAWAAPIIVLATAAPAAAAVGSAPPPPAPYTGPAFMIIGAGAGSTSSTKIYAAGPGPTRGTGDLAPGARFGAIGPSVSSQTAVITFTPKVAPATPPAASSVFQTFGGMTISAPAASGGGFVYTVAVATTASDPRAGWASVASFTVRSAAANLGTYQVVGASGRVGRFEIAAFDTSGTATNLTAQPTY